MDDGNRTNRNILLSLDPNLIEHPSFNCYDNDNHNNDNNTNNNDNDNNDNDNNNNNNNNKENLNDNVIKSEFANMMRKFGISSTTYSQIEQTEETKNSKNYGEIDKKKGKNEDINVGETNATSRVDTKSRKSGESENKQLDGKDEKPFLPPKLSSSSIEDQMKWRVDLISRIQNTFPAVYRCVSTNVLQMKIELS